MSERRRVARESSGFKCPECRSHQQRVIETRTNADGTKIRRRHECQCGHRFTSFSTISTTGSVSKSL